MKALWVWLTDDKNHRALQLIASVATGLVVGGWTFFTYLAKPGGPPLLGTYASAADPAPPALPSLVPLADAKARAVRQADDIHYFEDASGTFSVDQALLLSENKITSAAQLSQFHEVVGSDLRQCSESAAARPGLAEKLAARSKCLADKGYSANTQHYLRAKYGLAS